MDNTDKVFYFGFMSTITLISIFLIGIMLCFFLGIGPCNPERIKKRSEIEKEDSNEKIRLIKQILSN